MARIRTVKPEFWTDDQSGVIGNAAFWLYCIAEIGDEQTGPCKIGVATNLSKRIASLQGGNWRTLNLVWQIRLCSRDEVRATEFRLLGQFRSSIYGIDDRPRLQSEWIQAPPLVALECAVNFINTTHRALSKVG